MDDIYEDSHLRSGQRTPKKQGSKKSSKSEPTPAFGPSPWWLLGFLTSRLSITLILLSILSFPHLVWNLFGEFIQNTIHVYRVWEMLDSGNWYLSAGLAAAWALLLAREVLFYFTESYQFDPSTKDLVCVSFMNRMENYISLSLVYDIDIHKSSLINYMTGTGHIVLKHSTPENRTATTSLLWVRHPEKIRDYLKSKAGVSNARFVVSV